VAGFGGMRDHDGRVTFAPRLPPALNQLTFRMYVRETRLCVEIGRESATYRIVSGGPLRTAHHGEPIMVEAGHALTMPIPQSPQRETPAQPTSRRPAHRGAD